MSSSSAIADALVTMLTAASVFDGNVSKKSYKSMETSPCVCAVVSWTGVDLERATMANGDFTHIWNMSVEIFIRDTGNPEDALTRNYIAIDKLLTCLKGDDTILGQVDYTQSVKATRNTDKFITVGGATWLPIEVLVNLVEL